MARKPVAALQPITDLKETFTNRKLIIGYAVWWTIWTMVQAFVLHFLGLEYRTA